MPCTSLGQNIQHDSELVMCKGSSHVQSWTLDPCAARCLWQYMLHQVDRVAATDVIKVSVAMERAQCGWIDERGG